VNLFEDFFAGKLHAGLCKGWVGEILPSARFISKHKLIFGATSKTQILQVCPSIRGRATVILDVKKI
jgi:hypothetical protein